LLWACVEYATEHDRGVRVFGSDRNKEAVRIAQTLARLTGNDSATFEAADWLGGQLPITPNTQVVTAPPMGVRLDQPVMLPWHEDTTDGDALTLLRIGESLAPGRRATVLVPRRSLYAGGSSERVRQWLQTNRQVLAIIGLPAGVLISTGIAPAILVIANAEARSETLVAELQDDWRAQLSERGEFLAAFRSHLSS
jgi:hypothetical protein